MSVMGGPVQGQTQQQGQQPQGQGRALKEGLVAAALRGLGRLVSKTRPRTAAPEWSDSLVKLVDDEFDRRRSERMGHELNWRLYLSFINGNQYCDINPLRQDLVETPKLTYWEQREVFNHIAPIYETRLARISQMQPKLAVRPESSDTKHLSKARISLKLVDHCDRDRLDEDQRQAFFALLEATGTALLKQTWDPTAGAVIGQAEIEVLDEQPETVERNDEGPERGNLMDAGALVAEQIRGAQATAQPVDMTQEASGVRARTLIEVHEGDVRSEVVSPFEIYPDSLTHQNVEDCESIIHAKAYPAKKVQEIWGRQVKPEPDVETWGLVKQEVPNGGMGYGTGLYHYEHVRLKDHVVVKEYWERSSMENPDGRLVIVGGKTLLYYGPLPFNVDRDGRPGLPFVKAVCLPRPDCFFGDCIVNRLLGPQRRFNAWNNRKAEYLTRVAIGTLVIQEGSVRNKVRLLQDIGAPGTVIEVTRGTTILPQWLQTPSLPASFEAEGPFLLNQFTAISGVSETTRMSEAPEGVKSGVALDRIIEQDNTRLSLTVTNIETAKTKWAKQLLRLYKQFGDAGRVLRTVGSDNSVDILYWDSQDVTDDVIIQTSALLADTPAQRKQTVVQLLGIGFFNDPETGRLDRRGRSKVLELMQYGDWEYGTDIDEAQIKTAQRENHEMYQGQMPQVKDFHDESLHLEEHVKFMLSDEFREQDEKAMGALEMLVQQHIMGHAAMLDRKRQAMMKTQAPQVPQNQGGNVKNVA